jgi:cytochrome c oxidase subunit 2
VLQNLFGTQAQMQSGESVIVDEAYVRESILTPGAKVVAGFQPIMPTFQGLVSEEGLLQLIEYVKSLKTASPVQAVRPTASAPAPHETTPAEPPASR